MLNILRLRSVQVSGAYRRNWSSAATSTTTADPPLTKTRRARRSKAAIAATATAATATSHSHDIPCTLLSAKSHSSTATTPAKPSGNFMAKLREEQRIHSRHLLMARVGDFYEFYHEQAHIVSRTLGIKIANAKDVEFCGFPSYKLTDYVRALLTEGFSIAKYEQYEQEQANGERVLLRRVDRIYTPGTLVEEELVRSAADSQFLMALDVVDDRQESREANLDPSKRHSAVRPSTTVAFACVDLSSGAFHMDECAAEDLPHKLAFIQPKEILVSAAYNHVFGDPMKMLAGGVKAEQSTDTLTTATPAPTPATTGTTTNIEPDTAINADQAVRFLASMFAVHDPSDAIVRRRVLEHIVHKDVPQSSLGAASSLLQYVVRAQSGVLPLLDRPTRFDKDVMAIDVETQRSLELMRNMRRGDRHGTLFQYLDATVTPLGARALAARIVSPSASLPVINARHDMVQLFAGDLTLTTELRKAFARHLRHDPARAIQNLKFNYGGPWHLGIVLETLWGLKRVQEVLGRREATARLGEGLAVPGRLSQLLESVLADGGDVSDECSSSLERLAGLPRVLDRPGILRPECNRDLLHAKDEYEAVVSKSTDLLEELRSIFGVADIRLESKKPLGAYVEVESSTTPTHSASPSIHHLQTLGGSSRTKRRRYRVAKWVLLDAEISRAHDHYLHVERLAFKHVCAEIYKERDRLLAAVKSVSELDVAAGLAVRARDWGLVRPIMVVERKLRDESHLFQANDCTMDERNNMMLITGPNMGGKSTYLRQTALIAIMAQCGSFVPAQSATIGLVDRVFSRVGSSDDVARNQSSFMVEMSESAFILKQATPRSLIVMDEVGRGTSFRDGLSIAWAIMLHLHVVRHVRTLFATHYHELAEMIARDPRMAETVAMWRTRVVQGDPILFTHQLERGASRNSYGIHVARLAGLPPDVIATAEKTLKETGGDKNV